MELSDFVMMMAKSNVDVRNGSQHVNGELLGTATLTPDQLREKTRSRKSMPIDDCLRRAGVISMMQAGYEPTKDKCIVNYKIMGIFSKRYYICVYKL